MFTAAHPTTVKLDIGIALFVLNPIIKVSKGTNTPAEPIPAQETSARAKKITIVPIISISLSGKSLLWVCS